MSGVGDVFDPAAILPLALLLKATAVLAVAWALTRVVRSSSAARGRPAVGGRSDFSRHSPRR